MLVKVLAFTSAYFCEIEPFQWVAGDGVKKIAFSPRLARQVVGQRFKQHTSLVFPRVFRRAGTGFRQSEYIAHTSDFCQVNSQRTRGSALALGQPSAARASASKAGEALEVKLGVAEHGVDRQHAAVVMADLQFVRHPDAPMDLDGVLADEAASFADQSLAA